LLTKIDGVSRCQAGITLLGYRHCKSFEQGPQLVHIVDVECPKCSRKFRTVPSVVEHAGSVYCSVCGSRMNVSDPKPVSALSEANGNHHTAKRG
jgi:uncharacterized Zn finger protein (UPF0148 family)